MQSFNKVNVGQQKMLQYKLELIILGHDKIASSKDRIPFQDVVVALEIKVSIMQEMSIHVKLILYHESHVTKTQVDHVSEDDKVMGLNFHSMASTNTEVDILKFEITDFEVVAHYFAALLAVQDVVLFSYVGHSIEVLKEMSGVFAIEGFFFSVIIQVPDYDGVFGLRQLDSDANKAIFTSCSDSFNERIFFFFRDLKAHFSQ